MTCKWLIFERQLCPTSQESPFSQGYRPLGLREEVAYRLYNLVQLMYYGP